MIGFYKTSLSCVLLSASFSGAYAESVWHGYFDGSEQLSEYGTGIAEDYDCAVFFPGDIGMVSGKAVSRVRFAIQGTDGMTDLRIWLSSKLPDSSVDADMGVYEVNPEDVEDGIPYEVVLPEYCWVPDAGLYVGYSFKATDPFPLLTTPSSQTQPNGFFMRTSFSYPEWKDLSPYKYGNLPVEVLVEGDNYVNAVQVTSVPEVVCFPGETAIFPVDMMNYGSGGVTSIEYTLREDDAETGSFSLQLSEPVKLPRQGFRVNLEFPALPAKGISYKDIVVTGVNGEKNEMSESVSGHGAVVTIEASTPRSTVMEEFTGTWCGWCPRGMAGMEALTEDFGGQFIGIAVHGGNDPMVIDAYSSLLEGVSGFPSCTLDREVSGDPFFGSTYGLGSEPSYGIRKDVEAQLLKATPASVAITTEWVDGEKTGIKATVSLRLQYPRTGAPQYGLAYVVCADGLSGDGISWWQNNDFSLPMAQGYKDDPYLGKFTQAGSRIRDISYDDVAIAAYAIEKGFPIDSSLCWNGDDWQEVDSRTFDLSENILVQDKDRLEVVAMIIDRSTGMIVNAVKTSVGKWNSSDVAELPVSPDVEVVGIYDPYGRVVSDSYRGICIVRYSDGSCRKIMSNQ